MPDEYDFGKFIAEPSQDEVLLEDATEKNSGP